MKEIEELVSELLNKENCRIAVRKAGIYRFTSSYRYEAHRHLEYEVNYINSGNCIMTFERGYVPLKIGDCIVIPPWTKHGFLVDTKKGCRITQSEFSLEFSEGQKDIISSDGEKHLYYQIKDCEDIIFLMEQAARVHRIKKNDKYREMQLKLAVIQMITALKCHVDKIDNADAGIKNGKIFAIMEYLRNHYGESLNIEKLSEKIGISSRYVRRYFMKEIGMSCSDYITVLRINKAKELLWETARSVTEVALDVGYGTPQYFSRIFKEKVGITPSEYREKWKEEKEWKK